MWTPSGASSPAAPAAMWQKESSNAAVNPGKIWFPPSELPEPLRNTDNEPQLNTDDEPLLNTNEI
jgi:hypothetical protein